MSHLADADLLRVWDSMRCRSPSHRAAALLAAVAPELAQDALAALTLGERERHLLAWRTAQFGPVLRCVADCAACGEPFEFELDARVVLANTPAVAASAAPSQRAEVGPFQLEYRLPTVGDSLAAAEAQDAGVAYRLLLQRCLVSVSRAAEPVARDAVPDDVLQAADELIEAADGAAELSLALACPACGALADAPFDVAAFCWAEVEAWAPRLLAEVHTLAVRYGWHEADILAMSRWRRACYLELAAT